MTICKASTASLEVNGGGVAFFDYDADGRLDVFFANGCKLPLKKDRGDFSSRLYRNLGDGEFQDVTQAAGLIWTAYCQGVAVADDNNDGFDDLYVNCQGENAFWRNNGDGTFTNVIKESGTDVKRWGSSEAWADSTRTATWICMSSTTSKPRTIRPNFAPMPKAPTAIPNARPRCFPRRTMWCFFPTGKAGFAMRPRNWASRAPDGKGLGIAVFDFNRDGRPDIYVANDGMPNFLYVNRGRIGPAPL